MPPIGSSRDLADYRLVLHFGFNTNATPYNDTYAAAAYLQNPKHAAAWVGAAAVATVAGSLPAALFALLQQPQQLAAAETTAAQAAQLHAAAGRAA